MEQEPRIPEPPPVAGQDWSAPAILWEQPFVALANHSPSHPGGVPCTPGIDPNCT